MPRVHYPEGANIQISAPKCPSPVRDHVRVSWGLHKTHSRSSNTDDDNNFNGRNHRNNKNTNANLTAYTIILL